MTSCSMVRDISNAKTVVAARTPSDELPANMPVRPGDTVADKYRLDGLIAVGGMGAVFRARHVQLGQDVAIKVLLPDAPDRERAVPRFLREARAAAGIRNEHVVRIHDVDTLPDGTPYMVMELLEGRDLRALGREVQKFSVDQAVSIALQVCDALAEAHAIGIVHRDLKPSNLFCSERRNGQLLVKLVDFGISKMTELGSDTETTLTDSKAVVGSPAYMSPEQVREARSVDQRTDIWSLGVILYQMLTAVAPFRRANVAATFAAIVADPVPPLRSARPDVSPELEAVVARCLAKDVASRFQSADELRAALTACIEEASSAASAEGPVSRSGERVLEPSREPLLSRPDGLAGQLSSSSLGRSSIPSVSGVRLAVDPGVLRAIEGEVAAELGRLSVIGEVRADDHEIRLLGTGARVLLDALATEWPSMSAAERRARSGELAAQLASSRRLRPEPRHAPDNPLMQWVWMAVALGVLAFALYAVWLMLGPGAK